MQSTEDPADAWTETIRVRVTPEELKAVRDLVEGEEVPEGTVTVAVPLWLVERIDRALNPIAGDEEE